MLSEGLTNLLANDVPIKALLSPNGLRNDKTNGLFSGIAPKEVNLPYITYQQISGNQIRTLDGSPGLQMAQFQWFCYAASYKTAKTLAQKVKRALAGLFTTLNEGTRVEGCWMVVELDSIEEVPHAMLYGVMLSYEILFQEAATATPGLE